MNNILLIPPTKFGKRIWEMLLSNWIIYLSSIMTLLFILLSFVLILWRWRLLPPMIPLWYSKPWGTDQLAKPYWLFALPLGSLVAYVINLITSTKFESEYLIFIQALFLTSGIISFLMVIAIYKIIFLVT